MENKNTFNSGDRAAADLFNWGLGITFYFMNLFDDEIDYLEKE